MAWVNLKADSGQTITQTLTMLFWTLDAQSGATFFTGPTSSLISLPGVSNISEGRMYLSFTIDAPAVNNLAFALLWQVNSANRRAFNWDNCFGGENNGVMDCVGFCLPPAWGYASGQQHEWQMERFAGSDQPVDTLLTNFGFATPDRVGFSEAVYSSRDGFSSPFVGLATWKDFKVTQSGLWTQPEEFTVPSGVSAVIVNLSCGFEPNFLNNNTLAGYFHVGVNGTLERSLIVRNQSVAPSSGVIPVSPGDKLTFYISQPPTAGWAEQVTKIWIEMLP